MDNAAHRIEIDYDLPYATVGTQKLTLDLHRPVSDTPVPVVVYLHGGGWTVGDKKDNADQRLSAIARHGIAVAAVNYRLAPDARYPAQVHDVKAAVRWLRACGATHGLGVDRIGVWGASAGGCLATLVGLTAGDTELEGRLGDHPDRASSVQAVVAWFAPSDLIANSRRTRLEQLVLTPPVESALFGRDSIAVDDTEVAGASPLARVHSAAPPFLIAHGDRDHIASETQSRMLHDALTRARVDSTYCVLGGAGHEDPAFDGSANLALTAAWLRARLS
ncbi:alpha/beta hydrolase [Nocardia amikacinitolerans]|uniref:alpha/beta hydrolase n=1 Tax=Nocardia amikacinitolerans TaxID=756689 RepID=UPI0020A275FF|nr:alpha/beta hydrolase [Nocardia amikacinitolerans]MCP2280972.1 Acetyl esterase/lipase [Nocardia amikacinitolerans]MCP2297984.1 Acetyl esterase/lipase [Nocardia amikacinitolerans]